LALDDIIKLIDAGGEENRLAYNKANELVPADLQSPEDLNDLLIAVGTRGIDVIGVQPELPSSVINRQEEEVSAGEFDPDAGTFEKNDDPVRVYLREMGIVPLLTREGEVDVAKRIERGQRRMLKALSRSPLVIRQILVIGEDLKRGIRTIGEIVVIDDEEIPGGTLQNRCNDITCRIDPAEALPKNQSVVPNTVEDRCETESKVLSPLPIQLGPGDRSNVAHCP